MHLPADYRHLSQKGRRQVREEYVRIQNGLCCFCKYPLDGEPDSSIRQKPVRWERFPRYFLDNPIHLHHDHKTGLTIGAIHAYCNAVSFDYYEDP